MLNIRSESKAHRRLITVSKDGATSERVAWGLRAPGGVVINMTSGGGYNAFWVDPGKHVALVKGEPRSSWIASTRSSGSLLSSSRWNSRQSRITRGLRNCMTKLSSR